MIAFLLGRKNVVLMKSSSDRTDLKICVWFTHSCVFFPALSTRDSVCCCFGNSSLFSIQKYENVYFLKPFDL